MTKLSPSSLAVKDSTHQSAQTHIHETEESTTQEKDVTKKVVLPDWFVEKYGSWGERLNVPEWDKDETYRSNNGWQGQDLVHGNHSPVRILEYRVMYGNGDGVKGLERGGVGTRLLGVALFTKFAESHKGFCHGGSMCSIMDDIVGWCAFLVAGKCHPWSGFTVQVNASLKRPIKVGSHLLVSAKITKVEKRKVSIEAELVYPRGGECTTRTDDKKRIRDESIGGDEGDLVHATGEGLAIINRGVLPGDNQ